MKTIRAIGVAVCLLLTGMSLSAAAEDRHAGYYYPEPSAIEEVHSRALRMTQADRLMRTGFVIALVDELLRKPYAPTEYIFVSGAQAEKLIIVAAEPGRLDTLYRVRGYLATMVSMARATPVFSQPVFSQAGLNDRHTFTDLLKMLGFQRVTLSDGDTFTHQIVIK